MAYRGGRIVENSKEELVRRYRGMLRSRLLDHALRSANNLRRITLCQRVCCTHCQHIAVAERITGEPVIVSGSSREYDSGAQGSAAAAPTVLCERSCMPIYKLTDSLSVAAQITPKDIPNIAAQGFTNCV